MTQPLRILVILGSVREGRVAEPVGNWVIEQGQTRAELALELVDLKEWNLPPYPFPHPPAMGGYTDPLQIAWAEKIAPADGYILIAPEYNHGIPAALKEKIFQRFFRADSSRTRDTGGSGLGLAIVASIVAQHGGRVDVLDTPGGGATFQVSLPLLPSGARRSRPGPGPHTQPARSQRETCRGERLDDRPAEPEHLGAVDVPHRRPAERPRRGGIREGMRPASEQPRILGERQERATAPFDVEDEIPVDEDDDGARLAPGPVPHLGDARRPREGGAAQQRR